MAVSGVNSNNQMKDAGLAYFQKMDSLKDSNPKEYKKFYEQAYKHFTELYFARRRAQVKSKSQTSEQA